LPKTTAITHASAVTTAMMFVALRVSRCITLR
jgi:hypothetical protein